MHGLVDERRRLRGDRVRLDSVVPACAVLLVEPGSGYGVDGPDGLGALDDALRRQLPVGLEIGEAIKCEAARERVA